jgi:signal transduction histidine kinase
VLTILAFLVSTIVAERRARGIEEAADSIANNAMPSIQQLAGMRDELRIMEGLTREYAHRVAGGQATDDLVPRIHAARARMARLWAQEKETPVYPGETDRWGEIEAATGAVDAIVARIVAVDEPGDAHAQAMIYADLRPSVDRLSHLLLEDVEFNAAHARDLAARIEASRTQQRRLSTALDAASAVFAVVAALAVAGVLRSYTAITEARIEDLERFNGRVAHDVRSPLTVVSFTLDTVRQRYAFDEAGRAMLERAGRAAQRIGQVVDAMLVLARAGIPPEAGARAEVCALAREGVEELLPSAAARGVELQLAPCEPVRAACAPGVLAIVFSNLIGNAIKYIGDGPAKRVSVRVVCASSRSVRVEVLDTGPGVPPRLRERIFDPYVRSASPSIEGLGLGLATVRRLVEAHHGAAGVEPRQEGGSCFWVELPKAQA